MAPECVVSVRQATNKCPAVEHHSHGGHSPCTANSNVAFDKICHDKPLFIARMIDHNCVKGGATEAERSG
jgi:hypothetical protein